MVARSRGLGVVKMDEGGPKVQTSSYKQVLGGVVYSMMAVSFNYFRKSKNSSITITLTIKILRIVETL